MISLEETIKYTKKLRLLYVEDNQEARASTLAVLEEFFQDILVAVDGQDGLDTFTKNKTSPDNNHIDIIITDINMPNLNGLKMIAKIRKIDKAIPILVLSAYNESGFFIDSIKLGIEGYLLKPIDIEQFLGVLNKVVEKIQLQEESITNLNLLYQYQEITDKSAIVSKTDPDGVITYVNEAFAAISEFSKDELIGQNHNIVRHPDNHPSIYKELWYTIRDQKKIWQGTVRNISKNGKAYYARTTIKPILSQDGTILEYIALRDNITDIMNPKEQLNDLVSSAQESIVVYIKIEEFNDIEKFYGQKLASQFEDRFAADIFKFMPYGCDFKNVFVLGGGNYVLAKNLKHLSTTVENTEKNLKEFQKKVNNAAISIGDVDYDISVIISFSYGKDALENSKYGIKELIQTKQDFIVANNLAQKGQNDAEKNLQVLKMVKKALEEGKIISHFQPIVHNRTKKIQKYESLVRLIDNDENIISPYLFLDTAKKGKYYAQITLRVLQNSFQSLQETDMDISINLSVLDIEKSFTREKIFSLLELYKDKASRVVFELLEDEDVKDFNLVQEFISTVKKMGAKIAIDDFGAGYSNFERLLDYQPDILKIDGSLVKNIDKNSLSLSIVKTIVAFAKEQNIQTVAEYVENESIYNILNDLGVDYSQGYFFGKPAPLS